MWLAFHSLDFFWGQVVGKSWVTLLAVAALWVWRTSRRRTVAA